MDRALIVLLYSRINTYGFKKKTTVFARFYFKLCKNIKLGVFYLEKYKAGLICPMAYMDLTIVLCKGIEVGPAL